MKQKLGSFLERICVPLPTSNFKNDKSLSNRFFVDIYFGDPEGKPTFEKDVQQTYDILDRLTTYLKRRPTILVFDGDPEKQVLIASFEIEVEDPDKVGSLLTDLMRAPDRPRYTRIKIRDFESNLIGDTGLPIYYID